MRQCETTVLISNSEYRCKLIRRKGSFQGFLDVDLWELPPTSGSAAAVNPAGTGLVSELLLSNVQFRIADHFGHPHVKVTAGFVLSVPDCLDEALPPPLNSKRNPPYDDTQCSADSILRVRLRPTFTALSHILVNASNLWQLRPRARPVG